MTEARPKLLLLGGDGGRSGVPRYLGQVAEALADRAAITVVSEEDRGGFGFVHDLGLEHRVVEGLASTLRPRVLMRATGALGRVIAEVKPDVIWANARVTLPMARWCLRRGPAGVKLVATYHGMPFGPGHGFFMSGLQHFVERASLGWGPKEWLVFLTEEDRAAFGGLIGRHEARVLSNGSDLGGFVPRPNRAAGAAIRLVMLTRDAPQKDLDAAARLMAALPPFVTLALYGMGTQSEALKRRFAAILGAGGLARVRFGGPVADVRAVLAEADGFLVTSRYEGQSLAMLEAMEYGLPVLTTAVGGVAGMSAVHPMLGILALGDAMALKASAELVVAICRAWGRDRAAASARIHAAWAVAYGIEAFRERVRGLWGEVVAG